MLRSIAASVWSLVDPRLCRFLLERDVPTQRAQGHLAVLDIALARPHIVVATYPDCGCDACDCGSVDLLDAVDTMIGHVVGGPFVLLRGRDWDAEWHPDGGAASGTPSMPEFDALMELCRALANGEAAILPDSTPRPHWSSLDQLSELAPGVSRPAGSG